MNVDTEIKELWASLTPEQQRQTAALMDIMMNGGTVAELNAIDEFKTFRNRRTRDNLLSVLEAHNISG